MNNQIEIVVKDTVKKDRSFPSTLNEVRTSVKNGLETGRTRNGLSFIKILNTVVLF